MAGHQFLRGLLENAGRVAGGRVAHNHSAGRVGRLAGDPRRLQRERVDPRRVAVVAAHVGGAVGDQGIELLARGEASGEGCVVPASAEHPGAIGMGGGKGLDGGADLLQGGGVEQVGLLQAEASAHQVQVCVVQARQHRGAVRVDGLGRAARKPLHLAVGSDPENGVAANGERFGEASRAVGGVDAAVQDDQVHRPGLVVALRADDQADDEGSGDDRHDDERGQT